MCFMDLMREIEDGLYKSKPNTITVPDIGKEIYQLLDQVIVMRKVSYPSVVFTKHWNKASFDTNLDIDDAKSAKELNKVWVNCRRGKDNEKKTRGKLMANFKLRDQLGTANTETYNLILSYLFKSSQEGIFEKVYKDMFYKNIPRNTTTFRLFLQHASVAGDIKRSENVFQRIHATDVLSRTDILSILRAYSNCLLKGGERYQPDVRRDLRLRASKYLSNRLLEEIVGLNYYIRMFSTLQDAEEFVKNEFKKYDVKPDESTYYVLLGLAEKERNISAAKRLLTEAKSRHCSSLRLDSLVLSTISLAANFQECLLFVSSINNLRPLTEKEFVYFLRCCRLASTGPASAPYTTAKLVFKQMQLQNKETSQSVSQIVKLFMKHRSTSDLTDVILDSHPSKPWLWEPRNKDIRSFYNKEQVKAPNIIYNVQRSSDMPPTSITSSNYRR